MSAPKIDALLDLWASSLYPHQAQPPFSNHRHLYQTIDATTAGDVKWQGFSAGYTGEIPTVNPPPWMLKKYNVWFRDPRQVARQILSNPSFSNEIDLKPFEEYSTEDQTRQYKDFMSGEWAWEQAVRHLFVVSHIGLTDSGYHFRRREHARQHIRTYHTRERQNHCISCHGKQRILSPVHVGQKCT